LEIIIKLELENLMNQPSDHVEHVTHT